ncbi:MAG TPA: ribose 5-phosphate isomerase B [Thermoleophilia bacterium]|nr:ribose 5-phosphate isomerase B [Thermoleophilia bacterium]
MAVKIAAGADHAGFALKDALIERLRAAGHEVVDLGTSSDASVDYPVFAHGVADRVAAGEFERGLLVCGSGIGMCMAANRHPGVRAADCLTVEMAELSRRHNDANVLCLGARLLESDEAWAVVEAWLATPFEGGRHERRVAEIDDLAADPGH